MKHTTYIYFNYNKKKYYLYNSEDYKIVLSNGMLFNIPPWEERLIVCYLSCSDSVESSKRAINQFLNNHYQDFPFSNRDEFIDLFIKDHPYEISERVKNPLHSINGLYSFRNTSSGETITITDKEEKELADIVETHKENSRKYVANWFIEYYFNKGMNPFQMIDITKDIATSFIAGRGFAVNQGINIEGALMGVAIIWKILISIFGAIVIIILLFSLIGC